MHRCCQEIIGAAIPRDFPSRLLRIGLLHKSDYNESQRSSLYGHHIKKLFSLVNWPVITSTPLFRHYTKQVVAKNSPDIGFCQKIKVVSKGTGKKLLIDLTLLHSTHRTSEINLLDIIQKWSISFVMNKIDMKADFNTACIQNNFSDCHTENEVRCDVRYVLPTL